MIASSTTPAREISVWRLAAQQALRDFRAGELRLVLVAVMLAVAALSAVGFFADRLQAGLTRDAAQLLGGDTVISSDHPVPPEFEAHARQIGLRAARTAAFPSMARATDEQGGASRLVAVKAVSTGYPLRGSLTVQAEGAEANVQAGPAPGEVWADAAVLDALGVRLGDALLLGDARLKLAKVIVVEPDRGAGFLSFAPRVMLHEDDLPATGLVQPASRVTYRLALAAPAGAEARIRDFTQWAGAKIKGEGQRGMRVESLESGRPEMRQTLDRAEKFLNLVALLAALLAAVAVAIAARDFAQRHLDDCAMLRVLGLPQRRIAGAFAIEFVALGLGASLAGVLAGLAMHLLFVQLLGALVPATLPPPGVWPALLGLGVGLTLLLGFGLPPVLQLAKVPPLRVIRRDVGQLRPASLGVLLAGAASFAGLLLAVARDPMLGAIAVGGFAVALAFFALLAWLSVWLLRRAVPEARAPRWLVLATRQIAARPAFTVLQVSSLSVGLMALALLVLLRTDLIDSWRASTPKDAPNRFVINVQPDQVDDFRAALTDAKVPAGYDWYPMIRGRLVSINDEPVSTRFAENERARRTVEREFNLSHTAQMPPHNQVVQGQWKPDEADGLSIEQGVAETIGAQLGDTLRFDIGGQIRDARVTSIRKVDWGSMRANFFIIYPVARMDDVPVTFMAAFHAPDAATAPGFDNSLTRRFPNITAIDVSASVRQLQQVLDQVIRAVEFLFAFTLATGLAVLFAAVSATREARAREYAVMRACGAGAKLLGQVQRAELLGVGALAGLLATVAAAAVGAALARYAFEFQWTAAPWVPLAGALAGAWLALAAGWWSLRGLLHRPVMDTLRRAGEV
ncbi:FtsX-like permease family protein [Ideonella sp. DXS29W]|uniref:FtsX-like permease family protein n=1 Tax=Ideonella lacteola TaxID=2984193 RepID=A0ABU9BU73_9BURK